MLLWWLAVIVVAVLLVGVIAVGMCLAGSNPDKDR